MNQLPEKVVKAKSTNSFKNRLDKAWKNQDILYNFEAKIDNRKNIQDQDEADGPGEEDDSDEEPTPALRCSVASLDEGGVPSGRLGPSGS